MTFCVDKTKFVNGFDWSCKKCGSRSHCTKDCPKKK